jgi:hypothetical protein
VTLRHFVLVLAVLVLALQVGYVNTVPFLADDPPPSPSSPNISVVNPHPPMGPKYYGVDRVPFIEFVLAITDLRSKPGLGLGRDQARVVLRKARATLAFLETQPNADRLAVRWNAILTSEQAAFILASREVPLPDELLDPDRLAHQVIPFLHRRAERGPAPLRCEEPAVGSEDLLRGIYQLEHHPSLAITPHQAYMLAPLVERHVAISRALRDCQAAVIGVLRQSQKTAIVAEHQEFQHDGVRSEVADALRNLIQSVQ